MPSYLLYFPKQDIYLNYKSNYDLKPGNIVLVLLRNNFEFAIIIEETSPLNNEKSIIYTLPISFAPQTILALRDLSKLFSKNVFKILKDYLNLIINNFSINVKTTSNTLFSKFKGRTLKYFQKKLGTDKLIEEYFNGNLEINLTVKKFNISSLKSIISEKKFEILKQYLTLKENWSIKELKKLGLKEEELRTITTTSNQINKEFNNFFENLLPLNLDKNPQLIFGTTGSKKTLRALKTATKFKRVLFLEPTIFLLDALWLNIKGLKFFNENFCIKYHSKIPKHIRSLTFEKIQNLDSFFIFGTRSSLFLPFKKLDLIVLDEEGESSYENSSPYFNSEYFAYFLAKKHNAKILFLSATPKIEIYNDFKEKDKLVKLPSKNKNINFFIEKIKPTSLISNTLKEQLKILNSKGIIFHNRRGYLRILVCPKCNHKLICPYCGVNLVYHKSNKLECHYCGRTFQVPTKCSRCDVPYKVRQWGIDKFNEEIKNYFDGPTFVVDSEKTGEEKSQEIIEKFLNEKKALLIGTTILTKGLSIKGIDFLAISDFEHLLSIPNPFVRSEVFFTIKQLFGRAGRFGENTTILIQTSGLTKLVEQFIFTDYENFAKKELNFRKKHLLPPFCDLVVIEGSKAKIEILNEIIKKLNFENITVNISRSWPLFRENVAQYRLTIKGKNLLRNIDKLIDNMKRLDMQIRIKIYPDSMLEY